MRKTKDPQNITVKISHSNCDLERVFNDASPKMVRDWLILVNSSLPKTYKTAKTHRFPWKRGRFSCKKVLNAEYLKITITQNK